MARYKYESAADLIREKILSGVYKPGDRLPSIQGFAEELSLNTDTVIRAYKLLESEHLIYAAAKSGYYVMKSVPSLKEPSTIIDMLTAAPPNEVNPYIDFYHCMEKAILLYEHKLFAWSPPEGMPELIKILVKHLMNDQIFVKEKDVFITTGAQQALYILTSMAFPHGHKKILVEQPTYPVMLDTIAAERAPVTGIRRTEEGIDLSELENIFAQQHIKFFYLMPRFQNPTGFSYSNAQKKEILRLARQYHVYIVEDDYLADMEINPQNDPFRSFDMDGLVIYIRSFSKTLLPGLRLGLALVPGPLQDAFLKKKTVVDLNSSVFSQGALEIYLRSSMYQTHVRRIRSFYKQKMELLDKTCRDTFGEKGIRCRIPQTGIFACVEADRVSSVITRMEKKGLLAMNIRSAYLDGFPHPEGIRFCTCQAGLSQIPTAVQILKSALHSTQQLNFSK